MRWSQKVEWIGTDVDGNWMHWVSHSFESSAELILER